MKEIAVYGKGGIGKSTISANLYDVLGDVVCGGFAGEYADSILKAESLIYERNTDEHLNKAEVGLTDPNRCISKNIIRNEQFNGCAFNGAMRKSLHLQDAVILVHSPKSCSHNSEYCQYYCRKRHRRKYLFKL